MEFEWPVVSYRRGVVIELLSRELDIRRPQEKHLAQLHRTGAHTTSEIAGLFGIARSTVYRAVQCAE